MDLGDKKHQICILDAEGEILEEASIVNTQVGLKKFFKGREPAIVAMEVGTHSPWNQSSAQRVGARAVDRQRS